MASSLSFACLTELKKVAIMKIATQKALKSYADLMEIDYTPIEREQEIEKYIEEIVAVKEQHSAARTAIDTKLRKQTERKPEGWTGESKGGFGWKEYEYRNADGTTEFRVKMAICKGWKCGKEFAHNYDCCKACYEKACTRCGNKFGNPYKPMCKDCYAATNATHGQWRRTKRKGYAFK